MYDPYKDFKVFTLPNGVTVYHYYADRPWVMLRANVHVGWKDDPVGQSGLAHFVEHLVSKNIEGHDYQRTRDFFKRNGDSVEFGTTYPTYTQYGFRIINNGANLMKALDIGGLMLLGAKLNNHVERERSVINREFHQHYTSRERLNWYIEARKIKMKGHFLEHFTTPLGVPEHYMEITQRSLQDFYDKYYVPSNISVVVLGGIEREDLEKCLRDSLLGMLGNNRGNKNPLPPTPWNVIRPESNLMVKTLSDIQKEETQQTSYSATWALPTYLRRAPANVATGMLRHMLTQEIREKLGGTYSVSVGNSWWFDVMTFAIGTDIDESLVDKVSITVRECIDRLRTEKELFNLEKESRIISYIMDDLRLTQICQTAASELGRYHRIIPLTENLGNDEAVTHEDVSAVADHLSVEQQFTLIIKP